MPVPTLVFWRNLIGHQDYKKEDFDASIQGSPASDPAFVRDLPARTFFHQLKDAIAADPGGESPEKFAARVKAEIASWREVAKAAGIEPE